MIGSGWQATAQVEAHCHARPSIREVRVYSPNARRREAFAAEMANKVKAKVRAVASAEAAVRGASIVATATNSIEPVLLASWLEPGMFITSVKELEFEDAVYERCDVLTGNRRGPTWARYVVGGSQTIRRTGPRDLVSLDAGAMEIGAVARKDHRRARARAHRRQADHRVHESRRGDAVRCGRLHAL